MYSWGFVIIASAFWGVLTKQQFVHQSFENVFFLSIIPIGVAYGFGRVAQKVHDEELASLFGLKGYLDMPAEVVTAIKYSDLVIQRYGDVLKRTAQQEVRFVKDLKDSKETIKTALLQRAVLLKSVNKLDDSVRDALTSAFGMLGTFVDPTEIVEAIKGAIEPADVIKACARIHSESEKLESEFVERLAKTLAIGTAQAPDARQADHT